MRTVSIITISLSLAIGSALLTGCASTSNTTNADAMAGGYSAEPISADGATLRVNGMSCPKCANNIERQMKGVAGVEGVLIDLGAGVVSVSFTPEHAHPSRAQLAEAIEKTGFTLVSIDAKGAG